MRYRIEQRIHTVAQNVVDHSTGFPPTFTEAGTTFTPWQEQEWWTNHYWLATSEFEADNFKSAWEAFQKILSRLVPRISVVSQCYTAYRVEPFLILREGSGVSFVRWVEERGSSGLMFREDQLEALGLLLRSPEIPDEFHYYWNDATNSTGYASKLLLMLSAVEALVKVRTPGGKSKKDWNKLEHILGPKLKKDLWGTKDNHETALRHRLMHGEYFQPTEGQIDYFQLLHGSIIKYLNESILRKPLLDENIVAPQRHPFGNKIQGHSWIRALDNAPLTLTAIMTDMENSGGYNLSYYERVVDEKLWETY